MPGSEYAGGTRRYILVQKEQHYGVCEETYAELEQEHYRQPEGAGKVHERIQELKADGRRGRRARQAYGESAVVAKMAEVPQPDRGMAERLHQIIKANAPTLSPKTWYGMPA